MRRRTFLMGVGLASTAGCLRLQDGASTSPPTSGRTATAAQTDSTTTTTHEPTSTAEETTTQEPAEPTFPTGLSEEGVSAFLYPTHRKALYQTSYEAQWIKRDRRNSTVKWQKQYLGDHGESFGTWRNHDGNPVQMYRTVQGNYWREDLGDRVTFGDDMEDRDPALWGEEVQPLITAGDWSSPTRVNETRPAIWKVTTETVGDESVVPGRSHGQPGKVLSIPSAEMHIDERGVIRKLEARYRILDEGIGEFEYESLYTIDRVGAVSVQEPSWLSTAREKVPAVTATLTDDTRFIRFELESGNRLEPGTRVVVDVENGDPGFHLILDAPIEPNTPVYLYRPSDEPASGAVGRLSRGSRPADANPAPLEHSYSFYARRHGNFYFHRINGLR
ncbi:hypothetical protein [Haloarchaeobius sp. DT45]|uniref:hypothetical protein n=1 Tax=Haloarchaeobius sp. DT45 TaxID=3446116 RepID=UPI003F6D543F